MRRKEVQAGVKVNTGENRGTIHSTRCLSEMLYTGLRSAQDGVTLSALAHQVNITVGGSCYRSSASMYRDENLSGKKQEVIPNATEPAWEVGWLGWHQH